MYLHVDGARLANAAAALGTSLAALTSEAGVDVLSLGGTKNGMLYGDAALWFGEAAAQVKPNSFMLSKASSMVGSKMRFQAAQFKAMYEAELWRDCAGHANAMAQRLAQGLPEHCELAYVDELGLANEVFAQLPKAIIAPLQEKFHFYTWEVGKGQSDIVRWVTSWDTTEDEVDELLAAIDLAIKAGA
jgi:threonine aldolase